MLPPWSSVSLEEYVLSAPFLLLPLESRNLVIKALEDSKKRPRPRHTETGPEEDENQARAHKKARPVIIISQRPVPVPVLSISPFVPVPVLSVSPLARFLLSAPEIVLETIAGFMSLSLFTSFRSTCKAFSRVPFPRSVVLAPCAISELTLGCPVHAVRLFSVFRRPRVRVMVHVRDPGHGPIVPAAPSMLLHIGIKGDSAVSTEININAIDFTSHPMPSLRRISFHGTHDPSGDAPGYTCGALSEPTLPVLHVPALERMSFCSVVAWDGMQIFGNARPLASKLARLDLKAVDLVLSPFPLFRTLAFLEFLPRLTTLDLRGTLVDDYKGLSFCPDLETLHIDEDHTRRPSTNQHNPATRPRLLAPTRFLSEFVPKLKYLTMFAPGIEIATIGMLTTLRELSLRCDEMASLNSLHALVNLRSLEIASEMLGSLSGLEHMDKLASLKIRITSRRNRHLDVGVLFDRVALKRLVIVAPSVKITELSRLSGIATLCYVDIAHTAASLPRDSDVVSLPANRKVCLGRAVTALLPEGITRTYPRESRSVESRSILEKLVTPDSKTIGSII